MWHTAAAALNSMAIKTITTNERVVVVFVAIAIGNVLIVIASRTY